MKVTFLFSCCILWQHKHLLVHSAFSLFARWSLCNTSSRPTGRPWSLMLLESSLDPPGNPRNLLPDLTLSCISVLQPGTREAASNPIVIILSVVTGVVLVFFLINYALYVFAQRNKPKKAGKRVSCDASLLWHCCLYHCMVACQSSEHAGVQEKATAWGIAQQWVSNTREMMYSTMKLCQSWMRAYRIVS